MVTAASDPRVLVTSTYRMMPASVAGVVCWFVVRQADTDVANRHLKARLRHQGGSSFLLYDEAPGNAR